MARPLPLKSAVKEPFFQALVGERYKAIDKASVSKRPREPSPTKLPTYTQNGYHSPDEIL